MKNDTKIVTCCSWGQVRSVAARKVLIENYDCKNVLACGLDKNSLETLKMLFEWADKIFVVGEQRLKDKIPSAYANKIIHVNIGQDHWGSHRHPQLAAILKPHIKRIMEHAN